MSCDCTRPRVSRFQFLRRLLRLWGGAVWRFGFRRTTGLFADCGAGILDHLAHGGTLPCRAALLEGMEKRLAVDKIQEQLADMFEGGR